MYRVTDNRATKGMYMYRVTYMYVPPPPPRRTRSCLVPPGCQLVNHTGNPSKAAGRRHRRGDRSSHCLDGIRSRYRRRLVEYAIGMHSYLCMRLLVSSYQVRKWYALLVTYQVRKLLALLPMLSSYQVRKLLALLVPIKYTI